MLDHARQGVAVTLGPAIGPTLTLETFLPYRLTVLANSVNRILARLYEQKHGLTVAEWRLLAILARFGPLSANGVCQRSAMDKVRVSRAVARAVAGGLINRGVDSADRRRSVLTVTSKGRAIHDQIVPLALDQEAVLLEALEPHEVEMLFGLLDRLQTRAQELRGQPEADSEDDSDTD